MNPTTMMSATDAVSLIHEGWKLLTEQMGIQKATQFVMLLERGKGDSVEEIAEYWRNAGIDDVYNRVMLWKSGKKSNGG